MFEGIRSFIAELTGRDGGQEFDEHDYRKAAAAVLVHVADSDGAIDPRERARIGALLADRFAMPAGQARRMVAEAERSEAEAVDLYEFIFVLKRAFDENGRLKLVEMMWELAYADGTPLEVEDSIVARIAQMLDVSDSDLDVLRRASAPGLRASGGGDVL
jgi:uncharacterized tellurite resistance protein B-like protein